MALVAMLLLAGCNAQAEPKPAAPVSRNLYDVTKMNFKPGPAKRTNERHTGAFAAGSALNMDAAVKPLVTDAVKEIRIDTTHKIIEIAPASCSAHGRSATRCQGRSCVREWAIGLSFR